MLMADFQKVAERFASPNEQAVVFPEIFIISNCQACY